MLADIGNDRVLPVVRTWKRLPVTLVVKLLVGGSWKLQVLSEIDRFCVEST